MADAAAARREARRRRILENSHNRLQLISGKSVDTIRQEPASSSSIIDTIYEDLQATESEGLSLPPLNINNGVLFPELETLGLLSTSRNSIAAGDGEATNEFTPHAATAPEVVRKRTLLETLLDYKYDVVLLSLIIQFLYSCSLFSLEESYFFLPLVMYDVTKLIWFPPQSEFKLANVFFMIYGISTDRAQRMLTIMQWVQEVIQDGCVYLFTTICIQSLLISMNLVT